MNELCTFKKRDIFGRTKKCGNIKSTAYIFFLSGNVNDSVSNHDLVSNQNICLYSQNKITNSMLEKNQVIPTSYE